MASNESFGERIRKKFEKAGPPKRGEILYCEDLEIEDLND